MSRTLLTVLFLLILLSLSPLFLPTGKVAEGPIVYETVGAALEAGGGWVHFARSDDSLPLYILNYPKKNPYMPSVAKCYDQVTKIELETGVKLHNWAVELEDEYGVKYIEVVWSKNELKSAK